MSSNIKYRIIGIFFITLAIGGFLYYPALLLYKINEHHDYIFHKYVIGANLKDVLNYNMVLVGDYQGPKDNNKITILGYKNPPKPIFEGERLLLINESGVLVYLYFNRDGKLYYLSLCHS